MKFGPPWWRRLLGLAAVVCMLPPAATAWTANHRQAFARRPGARLSGLRVAGNRLEDRGGHVIDPHGVNRSGTEYACVQGWGIFDGPSTAGSIAAMRTWNINFVRVPLNEDCWLGINVKGINPRYVGQSYIKAVTSYVRLLNRYGIYAELSLIWAAPGPLRATYQPDAPDQDHAPAMWTTMARTFKSNRNVILAPWGETSVGWSCFEHGCKHEATYGHNPGDGDGRCGRGCWYYRTAGMQEAVSDMRGAGYTGPIAIPCIDFANDCADRSGSWLKDMPIDPEHQLLAEAHVYGLNVCDTTRCFNATMVPILRAGHPLLWGETGETNNGSDCPSSSFIRTFLTWAQRHGVGTEAWTWDTWGSCSSLALISSYNGTPEDAVGAYVRDDYRTLP